MYFSHVLQCGFHAPYCNIHKAEIVNELVEFNHFQVDEHTTYSSNLNLI